MPTDLGGAVPALYPPSSPRRSSTTTDSVEAPGAGWRKLRDEIHALRPEEPTVIVQRPPRVN